MRILDAIRLYISVHHGINGESGDGFDTQFLGDILSVTDDRGEANIQFLSYFLIDEAFGDEHKYLDFSGGKIVCIHSLRLRVLAPLVSVLVQLEDGLDKFFLALIDVQGQHTRKLWKVFATHKHNGTWSPFAEEGRMLEVDL